MNTPAHMILAATLFTRAPSVRHRACLIAALAGGVIPDLSAFTFVGWEHLIRGLPLQQVFEVEYRDPFWQGIFAVDNSIPLWTLLLALTFAFRGRIGLWPLVFAASGLLHILCDFALHHEDARRQLWPLSEYVFRSPLSYWDPRHHGRIVAPLEALGTLACCAILWRRGASRAGRAAILAGGGLEALCTLGPPVAMALLRGS